MGESEVSERLSVKRKIVSLTFVEGKLVLFLFLLYSYYSILFIFIFYSIIFVIAWKCVRLLRFYFCIFFLLFILLSYFFLYYSRIELCLFFVG